MTRKKIYFENLNGLRFLCFLSVFFYHSFYHDDPGFDGNETLIFVERNIFGNGNLGVNFFFVLSGFLITYLLIEERKLIGKIDIKSFWIRRILRIWPLYFACVVIGFVGFPILKQLIGQTSNETASLFSFLTFTSNFDILKSGLPDASILGVLWSIGVEEQFYLIWPIILSLFPIKKYWIPFSIIIISSLTFRYINDSYLINEFHTLSCIGDMTIGAFAAWGIIQFTTFKKWIIDLNKVSIGFIYVSFIIIYSFRHELFMQNHTIRIFERMLIAIIIVFIILEQNYSTKSFFKMSRFKNISKLGEITYGLYSLHFIGILIAIKITNQLFEQEQLWHIIILDTLLAFTFSLIIAKISYRYFEKPFLRLKEKFSYFKMK